MLGEVTQDDIRGLQRALERFAEASDRQLKPEGKTENTARVTVNAGGLGLSIALAMCALMLGMNIGLAALIVAHDRKIDDLNQYVSAIYMMAPSLKPKEQQ